MFNDSYNASRVNEIQNNNKFTNGRNINIVSMKSCVFILFFKVLLQKNNIIAYTK